MGIEGISLDVDPYFVPLAGEAISRQEIVSIVGNTLKHNQEAQAVADSTDFEKNFHIVNLLL
jgi:hypothetical protein